MAQPRQPSLLARLAVDALKILITLGCLYLAVRSVDFTVLWQRLARVNLWLFAGAVLLSMVQIAIVALRWRLIISALDRAHSLTPRAALAITFSAQFVGQFLPFAAGDALRALLVARSAGASRRTAITSVLIDRAIGLLVLFLIALPPLIIAGRNGALSSLPQLLLVFILAALAATSLLLLAMPRIADMMRAYPATRGAAPLAEDVCTMRNDLRAWAPAAGLSVIVHALSVIIVWTLSFVVAAPTSFLTLWILVPPMLLATMLPFTVSGWGARETVVVAFLAQAGIPHDAALLLSISFGGVLLISALPGAVTWLQFMRRPT